MLWKWIRVIEIVIVMEVLDTWQGIVEIGGQETELGKKGNWNMGAMRIMDKEE